MGVNPADETAEICESIDLERETYSGLRTQPGHEIGNRHSFRIEFENENHFVEVTNEIGDETKKLKVDDTPTKRVLQTLSLMIV